MAVLSSCNAWAVGAYSTALDSSAQTLIEHWNGSEWTQVPSPNPGGSASDNVLYSVAASSASNIWAVGAYPIGEGELGGQAIARHSC